MDAAGLAIGALLCWRAPMPDLGHRVELPVRVVEVKLLPSGEAGVWVQTLEGRLAGLQWHVAPADLQSCAGADVTARR